MRVRSRISVRTVLTQRSAYALAFGERMGARITLAPSDPNTASKERVIFGVAIADKESNGGG
jgi:hypothetical protein